MTLRWIDVPIEPIQTFSAKIFINDHSNVEGKKLLSTQIRVWNFLKNVFHNRRNSSTYCNHDVNNERLLKNILISSLVRENCQILGSTYVLRKI